MREETGAWFVKAEDDYGTAQDCLASRRFSASAFYSQQAAEKSLKALQIERLGRFDRVHDLLILARSLSAPKDIVKWCAKLTPYYVIARYPDVEERITGETVKELLKQSEGVVEWVRQSLKQ